MEELKFVLYYESMLLGMGKGLGRAIQVNITKAVVGTFNSLHPIICVCAL